MKKIFFLPLAFSLLSSSVAMAQEAPVSCQPPKQNEFLVLVVNPTKENQQQLRRALPAQNKTNVCKYLNDVVTRISGFKSIDEANALAQYVNEIVKLPAYVARPAETPKAGTPGYNPQLLGGGYAVLVDYFNKPEIATQIRRVIGGDVSLVAYGQRPYLLAIYTNNQTDANSTLQQLSDRGFWTMVVDSRRVVLLKSDVGN